MNEETFELLQLRSDPELACHRFTNLEQLRKFGLAVDKENYTCVYTGRLNPGEGLEDLYYTFNMKRPEDFRGHSMSVSDIVVLHKDGKTKAYFCDRIGFTELPDFFTSAKEIKTDLKEVKTHAAERRNTTGSGVKPVAPAERRR